MTIKQQEKERIAKYMAHAGVCSRRDAEKLITAGVVEVNGEVIDSPATKVGADDVVKVDGELLSKPDKAQLWLYYKPTGLVTSHRDEQGRDTIFDTLPSYLPRVVSVGRLDLNSEGLLLLTNNGELAGKMAHPSAKLGRSYRVRVYGTPAEGQLQKLRNGIVVDGLKYAKSDIVFNSNKGRNSWLTVTIYEGKNREIRNMFASIDCPVNRLIRVSYGVFELGNLKEGEVREVSEKDTAECLRLLG